MLLLGFEVCVVALVSSDIKLVNGTSYFLYSMPRTLHISSSKLPDARYSLQHHIGLSDCGTLRQVKKCRSSKRWAILRRLILRITMET